MAGYWIDSTNAITAGTWLSWNNVYATATTTATVWIDWNTQYTANTTAATNMVYAPGWGTWNTVYEESTEQKAERIAAEETRRRVAEYERLHREEESKAAKERANTLLVEQLSVSQREEYQEKRRFRVIARDGREFLLQKGFSWNAFELKDGKKVRTFCIHPTAAVPEEDVLISQKLMLETDPDQFIRVANKQDLHDQVAVA